MYCKKCGKQIEDNSLFCKYCGNKTQPINQNKEDLIIAACKDCVEKYLKAPSTVNYITVDIKDYDNFGRIFLYVELDAQNSFGAYIREKMYVILQSVDNNGFYTSLNEAVYKISFFATEDVVKKLNKWNKPK